MWRTYNESGTLAYSFVDSLIAMHPYYIARAVAGCCSWNAPASAPIMSG